MNYDGNLIFLTRSLMKQWYHMDHFFVILTLAKACPTDRSRPMIMYPLTILEEFVDRLYARPELHSILDQDST